MEQESAFEAFSSVTVGVADLDVARSLWVDDIGMTVVVERVGSDAGLARLWDIEADDISRQLLLSTGDARHGMIHLIEFVDPEPAVRRGADVFDLCPKNLDIYVVDMPARLDALRATGRTFRNDTYSEATAPDGTRFREMHMPSHDDINVVLLEVMDKQKPLNEKGFGGVGPLIYIVPDAKAEKEFVAAIFEFDKLNDNFLDGPEIERMVGLPPGAGLDVSIWGRQSQPLGELEIIDYQGVGGRDLYPKARPKATGILHVNFISDDLAPLIERLVAVGVDYSVVNDVSSVLGMGRVVIFQSPAGLRVEVHEVAELS